MAVAYRILVGFTILVTFVECQITSSLDPQITACVGDDVDLDWVYGDATNFLSVTWTYIDSQSTQTVIMQQNIGGSAAPVGGFNVVHKTNGGITLTGVNKTNSGSYKISVTYLSATASDEDTVAVTVNDCSKCTCECKCKKKCKRIVIPSIVLGSLGMIDLPVVYGGTVTGFFDKKIALAVDFFGFAFDVISAVLGIVVRVEDCCEEDTDCCEEDPDCCEDSDCCPCKENWIEHSAIAFIVIGCLFGILAIALFCLVWSGKIGPGNNGGNGFFCFNNGNDDGNDGGNDGGNNGHHRGRGTNSSTVHTERADTHRGTLSDRANSDGEVSRKDVHVQENRDNFSGRTLPPIPLTDKKGRGLSANYDDDNLMPSVVTPDKKTGRLVPLEEEQKKKEKKKKKKKKAVKDDDDE